MARFIPDTDAEEIEHDSERLVYEALKGLSSEYVVMHSFPWLRPYRDFSDEPLREGEADFVIIHAQKGMLIIEVKGGTPEFKDREWFRSNKKMKDPFVQAQRNMYELLKEIEKTTNRKLMRNMFTYGYAVIFPHCTYEGELPVHTDQNIFLDQSSLADLPNEIENAFSSWAGNSNDLDYGQFLELQNALMPKLRLIRHLGTAIAEEKEKIIQITKDQQSTLQGLLNNDRVLVEGVAGSGKTLLALEFAFNISKLKKSVLFLCYNKDLASWLNERIQIEKKLNGNLNSLEMATFHSFAIKIAKKADVEFDIPKTNSNKFWDDEVPLILEQGLEILRTNNQEILFDAVIVDEAQDFAKDWWVTVESLTKNGKDGSLYAFMDINQSFRDEKNSPPVNFQTRFPLRTNCRNTKSIAATSSKINDTDIFVLPSSPVGENPKLINVSSKNSALGRLLDEVKKLIKSNISANQIALISPLRFEKSILQNTNEIEGIRFVTDPAQWRENEGILVTTARSFKGLEADFVIIFDLEKFSRTFSPVDLYVAWTRARHRLILVVYDSEIKTIIEKLI